MDEPSHDRTGPTADVGPAVVETHISTLFLVGDRAYKVAKAQQTPYLDNRTVALRAEHARDEVALNRRLAPDVYLGVLEVRRADQPVDHVIEMRRMPPSRSLDRLLGTPEGPDQLRRVARRVAAFHATQARTPRAAAMAERDQVRRRWEQNLDELAGLAPTSVTSNRLEPVAALAREYLEHRGPLFRQRIHDGYARDGHGDLLAADIFCLDDGPRILDCLAFDEDLRVGDVLADVAFLVMDVERLAGWEPARRLLGWYCEFSGEHHPASLAHHYVAYRALVRAKVAAAADRQHPADEAADRPSVGPVDAVGAHLDQARAHLERGRVRLVLVGGGPGTGKTTLSDALGRQLGAVVERSDELRKDLAGLAHDHHGHDRPGAGLYDEAHTRRTYEALVQRATDLLGLGQSVVLDASFTKGWERDLARRAAERAGAHLVELECRVPAPVARERLVRRAASAYDASDATPEIADHVATTRDPWPEVGVCDTTIPLGRLLPRVVRAVLGPPPASRSWAGHEDPPAGATPVAGAGPVPVR